MIIECPVCGTKNRLPDTADRRKTYRCGNCKASLTVDSPARPSRPKARRIAASPTAEPRHLKTGVKLLGIIMLFLAFTVVAAFANPTIGDKVEANRNETLDILTVPNEGLRQAAEPVDVARIGEQRELVDLLINTAKKAYHHSPLNARAGGVSAPQVGVPKRVMVVTLPTTPMEQEILVMLNPEIIREEGSSKGPEQCLSIPREGAPIRIARSDEIAVSYFTPDGVEEVREFSGNSAAVVQHHIDHLNGVLITDEGKTANVIPPIVVAACILAVFLFAETRTSLLTGVSETATAEARASGIRRLLAAGKEETSGLWLESIAYLLAVGAAEALLLLPQYWGAMAIHGVVLVVLLLRQAQMPDLRARMLLLSLALVPVYRLASAVAVSSTEDLEHAQLVSFAIVSAILLVAIAGLVRYRQLDLRQLGIARGNLSAQFLIGLTGAVIGPLLYLMVEPDPLVPESEWGLLAGAVVVILAVASAEELVFRGILQRTSTDLFGARGLVYVSTMFALIHLGSVTGVNASIASIPFIFGVALFYAWAVRRTGSVYGVILSHVITNVIFFVVMPWLL